MEISKNWHNIHKFRCVHLPMTLDKKAVLWGWRCVSKPMFLINEKFWTKPVVSVENPRQRILFQSKGFVAELTTTGLRR